MALGAGAATGVGTGATDFTGGAFTLGAGALAILVGRGFGFDLATALCFWGFRLDASTRVFLLAFTDAGSDFA